MAVKVKSDREKWKEKWYVGTPFGGGVSEINPDARLTGMDGTPLQGMDGTPLKPVDP